MSTLIIVVPEKRDRCGRASLIASDGTTVLGPLRILASASRRVASRHGNTERSRMLPFGDPPSGRYVIAGTLPPHTRRRRPKRFGPLGAFVLKPESGEAKSAGRHVVLHGGAKDPRGRLRRTRGGLRVSDADLAKLIVAINARQAIGDPVSSVDLIDAPASPEIAGAGDLPGGRRYRVSGGTHPSRPKGTAALGLTGALLGAWLPNSESPGLRSRRTFLKSSLLLLGALGASACAADNPGACDDSGNCGTADGADGAVTVDDGGADDGGDSGYVAGDSGTG